MNERDDVIRLGRHPERVPLREVFPWWFLGGAITHLILIIALAQFSPSGTGLIVWGVVIGMTIRDRRAIVRRLTDRNLPATRATAGEPRWLDPALTGAILAISLGLSLLLGNLFSFDGDTNWPAIAGGALIAFGALAFGALVLRTLSLRAQQRRQQVQGP